MLEYQKLQRQLEYVWERSSFYRQLWGRSGFEVHGMTSKQDLNRIPLIAKRDLRRTQEEEGGLGGHRCAPYEKIVRIQGTSGTTGRFVYTGLTRHDTEVWAELFARHAWIGGLRPGDAFFNPFNFALSVGGLSESVSAERMGMTVIPVPFSSVSLEKFVQIARDLKPTVLCATPSLAIFLQEQLRTYFGIDPAELGFKKGFITGEVLTEQDRRRIEDAWEIDVRNYYGLTEVAPDLAAECEEKSGMHFVGQGYVLLELVDPETGAVQPLEDGVIGELVFTTIDRECCPVVRYATGDVAQVFVSQCKCGRDTPRIKIMGRKSEVIKVGGQRVFPLVVYEIVASFIPETTGEVRIARGTAGDPEAGRLRIKVEYGKEVVEGRLAGLKAEIKEKMESALGLGVDVVMVPPYSLRRSGLGGCCYKRVGFDLLEE